MCSSPGHQPARLTMDSSHVSRQPRPCGLLRTSGAIPHSLHRVHLLHLILLSLLLSASLVTSSRCVHDGCDCRFIAGKNSASCIALNLTTLPQCDSLSTDEVEFLHQIHVINLTQNHFPELKPQFFHKACLDNLQKIYIQQAGLQNVDDNAFHPLKIVIELSLSSNFLTKIPSKAIENLSVLRFLDLSNNNIRKISNDSFKTLSSLKTLLLNDNQLTFIDTDCFNGLTRIEKIMLNSNQLVTLQPEAFTTLKVLHSLYLENNSWDCNCRMQPFKRMLLLRPNVKIHDNPRCSSNSVSWSNLDLENFQCAPTILRNFSDSDVTISEGSILRLKCAIFIETFGDSTADDDYLSLSQISWHWNDILLTNNSKGCDNCKSVGNTNVNQQFQIQEYVRKYDSRLKIKISNLELYSVMTVNEGNYICNATNKAGKDELAFHAHVIPYYTNNNNFIDDNKITSAASSDTQILSYKNKINPTDQSNDHILFGLVLGILGGLFLVLVIFSFFLVFYVRKNKDTHQPHELVIVDASTDNNTVDENHETNTETTEKLNVSQTEFNPLLVVNPIQKPPRLGIPDVSSIYSNPSWTMDRANYNRSRYASYAETEPLYSDYYTLYRPNRHISRLDNRTFISDTASEV